jgi:hypothetical protein
MDDFRNGGGGVGQGFRVPVSGESLHDVSTFLCAEEPGVDWRSSGEQMNRMELNGPKSTELMGLIPGNQQPRRTTSRRRKTTTHGGRPEKN